MIFEDTKLDESFSERRSRPESRDELLTMQRVLPPALPATHVWEYRWVDPSADELKRNRYLLPQLVQGPRELTLQEVSDASKSFESLKLGELKWLLNRHAPVMPPLKEGEDKQGEEEAIRQALVAHLKAHPDQSPKNAVKASRSDQRRPSVIDDDIAAMDDKQMETKSAELGLHSEYKNECRGKPLTWKREWLSTKRREWKNEPVTA